ncbi:MAG: amidohydrolase [Thermovirgaceae bacterium]|nr:amidohydrolase [Synergistales bacterium]
MAGTAIGIRGSLWTGDPRRPRADALVVKGGDIVSVGSYEEVRNAPRPGGVEWIDAGRRTVLPGMTDSHLHLGALVKQGSALSLYEASSREDLLAMVRRKGAELGPGCWVHGVRFDNSRWPDTALPTLEELDDLGLPNPVLLVRVCTHVHVVNSRALQEAGLSAEGLSGAGVVRDGRGRFTGALLEGFAGPVIRAMGRDSAGAVRALKETMLALASEGITGVHTCSAPSYGLGEDLGAYRALHERGELPVRVRLYSDEPLPGWKSSGEGDEWLCYGGRKFFLDGSLGGRTAAMTFPYEDAPSTRGALNMSDEEFLRQARDEHAAGNQLQVHAIGDAAVDQFIRAMVSLGDLPPLPSGLRHRVVHLQVCRPDQVRDLARLGAVCDVQPAFVPSDIAIAEGRIGRARLGWAYAWKSMLRAGLLLTGSSDAPVEPANPFRGVWAAVNRVDDEGRPAGGWLPSQKLTLDEALALFTVNAARAVGQGGRSGSLRPGSRADLVILDRDIGRTPPGELKDVKPLLTMAGGKITFQAAGGGL